MKKLNLFGALAVAAVAIVACTGQAEQKKPQGTGSLAGAGC